MFYVAPIKVKGKDKLYCIINMEKDHIVQRINILDFYRPSMPQDPTTVCPGSHNNTPRIPSEGTLLNVYTIKDKP